MEPKAIHSVLVAEAEKQDLPKHYRDDLVVHDLAILADHKTQRFLEGLAATLPSTPKALLVVSGHWEEPAFTASAAAQPKLIFDYSGFPEHTYQLTWPAPGEPGLPPE